jgi:peptidoglycan/LPS O-acetylase OafA/YrhL
MGRFHRVKRRTSFGEVVVLLLFGLAAFWLIRVSRDQDIPLKWVTALIGTAVSFGLVVYLHRKWLTRRTFWTAFLICLLAHCVAVFVFFQFVLRDVSRLSPLLWSPVMIFETFGLLIAIAKIENKFGLDRKDKPIRLTF